MKERKPKDWVRVEKEKEKEEKKKKAKDSRNKGKEKVANAGSNIAKVVGKADNATNGTISALAWGGAAVAVLAGGIALAKSGVASNLFGSDKLSGRVEQEQQIQPEREPDKTRIDGSTTAIMIVSQEVNWRSAPSFNSEAKSLYPGTVVCKIGNETGTDRQGDKVYTFGLYKIFGDEEVELRYIAEYYQEDNNPETKKTTGFLIEPEQYRITETMDQNSNPFTGAPVSVLENTVWYMFYTDENYIIARKGEDNTFEYAWADSNKMEPYNNSSPDFLNWLFYGNTKVVGAKNVSGSALAGAQIATAVLNNGDEISVTNRFRNGMKVETRSSTIGSTKYVIQDRGKGTNKNKENQQR